MGLKTPEGFTRFDLLSVHACLDDLACTFPARDVDGTVDLEEMACHIRMMEDTMQWVQKWGEEDAKDELVIRDSFLYHSAGSDVRKFNEFQAWALMCKIYSAANIKHSAWFPVDDRNAVWLETPERASPQQG